MRRATGSRAGFRQSRSAASIISIALLVTALFFWLLWYVAFPLNMLAERAQILAEARGINIEFTGLEKGLVPGVIEAESVRVSSGTLGGQDILYAVEANNILARFRWAGLLTLRAEGQLSAEMNGVPLSGEYSHPLLWGNERFLLSVRKAPLASLVSLGGLQEYISSTPEGTFSLDLSSEGAVSELKFGLDSLKLGTIQYAGLNLPTERLREGRALLRLAGDGALEVVSANLSGEGVFVRARGKLSMDSLDVQVELMLEALDPADPLLMMLLPFKTGEGRYLIKYKS